MAAFRKSKTVTADEALKQFCRCTPPEPIIEIKRSRAGDPYIGCPKWKPTPEGEPKEYCNYYAKVVESSAAPPAKRTREDTATDSSSVPPQPADAPVQVTPRFPASVDAPLMETIHSDVRQLLRAMRILQADNEQLTESVQKIAAHLQHLTQTLEQ
jgi:hypothetical protein